MPFTLAHPAAVLPLLRTPLVPSALVAGSVAPDLPYYVSLQWLGGDYNLTRTHAVSSILWLDPLIALVLLAAFHLLLQRPLLALLPGPVAERAWPVTRRSLWRGSSAPAWIVLSVAVGAATHLAWDALGTAAGPSWAGRVDLVGSALGGVALAGWLAHWWRTTPRRPVPPGTLLRPWLRRWVLAGLAATAVLAGSVALAQEMPEVQSSLREQGLWNATEALRYGSRILVVHAGTALGAATIVYALGWHRSQAVSRPARALRPRWRRPGRSPR